MIDLEDKIKKKKWPKKDIDKTITILRKAKLIKKKKNFDKIIYWSILFVAIIGNLIISITLVPFLLALNSYQLYLIVITLGLSFGFLFNILIIDIENLEKKHYIIAGIFIPSLAIINIAYMTMFSNYLIGIMHLHNITHNPVSIGIAYAVSFVVPLFIYTQLEKDRQNSLLKIES